MTVLQMVKALLEQPIDAEVYVRLTCQTADPGDPVDKNPGVRLCRVIPHAGYFEVARQGDEGATVAVLIG